MKKKLFSLFSIFIAVLMIFGMVNLPKNAVAQAPDQHLEKVENKVLDALSTDGSSDYVIEMAEKADLSKAYSIMDWSERGWFVYDTLREVAERTQKPIIELLKKQGIKYQSFFAANEIAVYGSGLSTLTEISSLKAVDHIRFPRTATIDPGFLSIQPSTVPQASINALDWGITDTNADDFWSAFGLQGDGLVVANIDTGVQWDHPALDQSFKCGTDPTDPACWADPANICGGSACDNNGHGTHTMGTMVGDDDPSLTYQVGMAPNAQWIACKGCESTDCSEASLNACADWILAPAGNPANRPHIVNNSWGGGGGDAWYLAKVNSWRAAGIFPAFSAGNSGPACGSIGSPGDYQESFATANHQVSRLINSGSSRGPSTYGDDPYTKPNLSAPGTNICSSVPGSAWNCGYTGTSMAAPHVAGAVALLWSCNPSYIGNMTATFELLQDTADPPLDAGDCGAPTDGEGNFTYGYGYLNVLAAGQQVCAAGTIAGTVTDGTTAIEGATITADNGVGLLMDTLTLADGTYTLNVPGGTYTVSAAKYGYSEDVELGVAVTEGSTTTVDFVITPLSTSLVSGYVYDGGVVGVGAHGYPLYSAIDISAPGFYQTIYTDPFTGYYEIDLLDSQSYSFDVQAVPPGYSMLSEVVTPTGTTYSKDFALIVGPSCSAPGYQKSLSVTLSEGFESGALPAGWVNYDYIGNGQVWQFNNPGERGNYTPGGEGGFAILDSDNYGPDYSQDAGLRTPVMDFTGEAGVVLDFDTDFNYWSSADSAIVWVSNDSGATWAPVWTQTTDFNGHVTLDISAQAANQADVIVEFNYIGSWGYWWQVDDVVISSINCDLSAGGVVAGYVYDANDGSPIVAADVYSDMVATQTFFIPEDPASEGLFWIFHPVMGPPPVMGIESLAGTNITFDPTAGGAAGYIPGVPTTLCFESNVYSPDWEWLNGTWLKFPSDWTISSTYLVGIPTCDLGTWPNAPEFYWETEPFEILIEHLAVTDSSGDHCVAEYCVDVTPGASAALVSWYYLGDGYANTPHYPCSSDVYTPTSMVGLECDEWVNPQASIPMLTGESHDFTAEKDLYGSDTETVFVVEDIIVQQDFTLGTGELSFAPTSFEVTMYMGDPATTETLTISNIGSADVDYTLAEVDQGYTPPAPLAAVERNAVADINSNQLSESGFSGSRLAAAPVSAFPNADVELILDDGSVENNIGVGGTIEMLWLNRFTPNPASFPFTLNEIQVYFETAGAVNIGDDMTLVVYENTSGNTDPAVGANFLAQFLVTVQALDAWNTFALPTGVLFTGPGDVLIGVIGMEVPGTSYWPAAIDQTATQSRSWAGWWSASPPPATPTLPPDTEWTLIDAYFPGNWMVRGMGSAGSGDVIWLSENPVSGTIPGGGSQDVTLTIDPASLTQPGDYLAHLLVTHDTPYVYPQIPVLLHLLPSDTYGTFNGTVTGLEVCDLNPMPLDGATVNFWQGTTIVGTTTTIASGYFSYALPAGTYDIEFVMDGYVTDFAEEIELATQSTVTVDMELRLDAPCLSVDPTSLEQTQPTDTTTTQTLTIINTGAGDATVELMEINGGFQPPEGPFIGKVPSYQYSPEKDLPGLDKSKTIPIEQISHPGISADLLNVLINEGFETLFPPSGWAQVINNPSYTWIQSTAMYYEGSYGAYIPWNYAQDEWLLTPEFALAEGTLSLYSSGSVYWCRDTYDNCDLNVWLVVGEVGGGDDIFVKNLEEDWSDNFVWTQATIDLAPFLPGEPVRIGFQLIGDDDADTAIDMVVLDGVEGLDVPWLTEDPVSVIVPAGDSYDVTIGFDSTGLVEGDYLATLRIKDLSGVKVDVPVTLHVTQGFSLFLPLILK